MAIQFMTANQVATEFFEGQCSYQKVLRMTRQGILPGMKIGKSYLFRCADLEKWASENFCNRAWSKVKL